MNLLFLNTQGKHQGPVCLEKQEKLSVNIELLIPTDYHLLCLLHTNNC